MGCSRLAPCIPVLIFSLLFWLNSPILRKQHVTLAVIALHYDVRVHHPYACLHLPHEISFLQLFQRGCHRLPAAPCALHDLLVSGGKAVIARFGMLQNVDKHLVLLVTKPLQDGNKLPHVELPEIF